VLEVVSGFGVPPVYYTGVKKANGKMRRFKSGHLPPRYRKSEAQQDLDKLAGERGWPAVEG
jgi:hypothetical protein